MNDKAKELLIKRLTDQFAMDEDMSLAIHLELMHMSKEIKEEEEMLLRKIDLCHDPKTIDLILDQTFMTNALLKDLIMEKIVRNQNASSTTLGKMANEIVSRRFNHLSNNPICRMIDQNPTHIRICKRLFLHQNITEDIIRTIVDFLDCPDCEVLMDIIECKKIPEDILLKLSFNHDRKVRDKALEELRRRRSLDPKI